MKMMKSLLLGSAAGLVAVAGAQAADLPVKAKPVEYVKVCSVYGAGFYYIPGTETCLKIGGFARADITVHGAENDNPYRNGSLARNTREDTSGYNTRYRGIVSFDARSQTEFGTLRSYIRAGWELNSSPSLGTGIYGATAIDNGYRGNIYFDRAFIQFAGITVGKSQSFFDFYANALNFTTSYVGGSDTGHGINLLAYTAQFAGGFSGTISLEDQVHRRTGLWDASTNGLGNGNLAGVGAGFGTLFASTGALATPASIANAGASAGGATLTAGNYAAQRFPDIVGNLRVDQPWGAAQLMAALHDASGSCYGATCNQIGTATDAPGGPGDRLGYAVGGGLQFNLPFAQGDQLWLQATYARGAASYVGFNSFVNNSVIAVYGNGSAGTFGTPAVGAAGIRQGSYLGAWGFDGIFQTGTRVALTDGFQANAAIQHFWTPSVRTSVFGGVAALHFDQDAKQLFCTGVAGTAIAPGANPGAGPRGTFNRPGTGTCNPDFAVYQVGTRTIWSPVKDLDIGVELLYTKFDQNFVGDWNLATAGSRPAGIYRAADLDTFQGLLRFQRNFVP